MAGWHYQLNGHEFEQNLKDSEGPGEPGMLQSMGSQRVRHDLATIQQQQQYLNKVGGIKSIFYFQISKS